MSETVQSKRSLSPAESRARLASLLRERMSRPRTAPVSYGQRRFWFLDQLDRGNTAYNIPAAVRLRGALDVPAFRRAFSEIVRRHEILRTTFSVLDGEPQQLIHPPKELPLPIHDLTQLPAASRQAEVERLAAAETRRPFDLQLGPLLRVSLLQLGADDHVLLLSLHHIISDGWSMNILIVELQALYHAYSNGRPSPLRDLGIQYADYAQWQRKWLRDGELDQQLAYWRTQLAGVNPFLSFPSSRTRPAVQTFRGAAEPFELSAEVAEALRALSQREGVTLFITLLAAFQTLLFRYTGETDVVVGTPIANRNRAQVENLIGLFANTLVLRTNLSGNPSFREVLRRAKEVALGAYAHQDLPFEKLVEELQPERNLSYTPLFQVMLSVQNVSGDSSEPAGLSLEPIGAENLTAKFDLTLSLVDSPTSLRGSIEYNSDLFDAESISRLARHFQTLLGGIVANEEARIGELELLTEGEREQLAVWSAGEGEFRRGCWVPQLFEQQVEQRAAAVAVQDVAETLNYRELNERANQLAHYLKAQHGVGPEVIVGVCLERSVAMVVAVLGIMKAGGAYVPLDPAYPEERLSYMVEDAGAAVVVTQAAFRERFAGRRVVLMDQDREAIRQGSRENPQVTLSAANLAYVIYTSGSTGRPKGVGITHGSVAVLVEWAQGQYTQEELAVVLAGTSLSFDLSSYELYVPLTAGQRVVVGENVLALRELGERAGVTLINSVPSAVKELLREGEWPRTVRTVNLAGEALGRDLVDGLYAQGVERVYNLYGPSEDTTYTTCGLMKRDEAGAPSIGRPIGNTWVYVLDGRQRLAPAGVVGEIYVTGAGLARGYLGRAELTAERFVPDGVSGRQGERLYRTGDLGRWRADGELEYLGRVDEQVKVRGFRIELGEIEARLREHDGVREAVVVVQEDGSGDKRLVGYVVAAADERLDSAALRSYLQQWLPEHMVPAVLVQLPELPLTPNGKINRKALPAVERALVVKSAPAGAGTAIEELVGNIWAEVLGVERVGLSDNFFELGGHSLLATRVVSRVRETFHLELPVRTLFEKPTVAELAAHIEGGLHEAGNIVAPPIKVLSRDRVFPLSFAQLRLWFIDQMDSGAAYTIPAAFRLDGSLNVAALKRALTELVRRHESLRTTFAVIDGQPAQILHHDCELDLPLNDLSELNAAQQEAETERLTALEIQTPFNLQRYPLLRASLIRLRDDEHIALFTIHHIISDGWSLGVFIRELGQLYSAFSAGQDSPLAELPIQYLDFSVWQREWLRGEVLEQQLSWWKNQLGEEVPVLELPADRPRPAVLSYRGDEASIILDEQLTQLAREFSRRQGVTLFIALLAVFKLLLFRYTGQDHIVVGTPIANRTRTETEGLIGLFVNTLALGTRLHGGMSFQDLLNQVRETVLGAHTHQDLPIEILIDELQIERTRNRTPLFQVLFALQNLIPEERPLPGLNLTSLKTENKTAKFDLDFSVVEMPDALRLSIRYSTDLFDAARIERILEHYRTLLETALSNPWQSIDQLPLLTNAEREQLVVQFNDTAVDYTIDKLAPEQFAAVARREPGVVAVVSESESLTYGELNEQANQLAHYLRRLGVGPEQVVGMCQERSVGQVVSLLGVLKAGGAYLPLEPSYPEARLRYMLEDAGAKVVLTHSAVAASVPNGTWTVVRVDEEWERIAQESGAEPVSEVNAENLAYVLYTSGTTGHPKGAMITHGSLINLWRALGERVYGGADERRRRVSLNAPLGFDSSVKQWVRLLSGDTLCVVPETVRGDGERLLVYLAEAGVEVLDCTPSQLRLLNGAGLLRNDRGWQPELVLVGGEALEEQLWQELSASSARTGVKYYNVYGPTECTVDATCAPVSGQRPVLGRVLPNVRGYVLDKRGEVAAVGVTGELYLGGAGVGRGYLGQPALTAERFVPDALSGRYGERLYRTGDEARFERNGELEYVGRVDEQVKIRGFRIELGEIEAALREHPSIRESVVVVHTDKETKRLVAYVVGKSTQREVNLDEVQQFIRERLPKYMVPTTLIVLPQLPLTANGKINYQALPIPLHTDRPRKQIPAPLVDPFQQVLGAMWKRVLNINEIGAGDDFFELGGDSIQGAIFINQLREKLKATVSVATLFSAPTLERLADLLKQQYPTEIERLLAGDSEPQLDRASTTGDWSPLVRIQQGKEAPLFLVHPVGGNVFCYVNLSRQLGLDHTIYGLQARGLDPKQAPQTRIEEMAAYYIDSLRSVQPAGPYRLGGWSMGGLIAFEMARQLVLAADEVSSLVLLDSHVVSSFAPADDEDNQLPLLVHFAADLGLTPDNLKRPLAELLQLSFDEQLTHLLELAKSSGMVPEDCDVSYLRQLFHVFQTNYSAAMSYQPGEYPGRLSLLLAQDGPAKVVGTEATWRTLALGGVDTYHVPGNHYSMFRPPHLQTLAAELRACLSPQVEATALMRGTA